MFNVRSCKSLLNFELFYFNIFILDKPRVFFKNLNDEVLIGEIAKLECFGESNPVAPMKLYFNGICLKQTDENILNQTKYSYKLSKYISHFNYFSLRN